MNKQFRVWDGKKFLAADSFCLFPEDDGTFMPRKLGEYGSLEDIPNAVTQQFTGLFDKNGQKIFEGDIVDYRYDGMSEFEKERYANLLVSPVYWEYERWRIKYSAASYAWHLMKVIGNIFETPELLK